MAPFPDYLVTALEDLLAQVEFGRLPEVCRPAYVQAHDALRRFRDGDEEFLRHQNVLQNLMARPKHLPVYAPSGLPQHD